MSKQPAQKAKQKSAPKSKSSKKSKALPRVGVIMGSDSDLRVMQASIDCLNDFGVAHEVRIVSAHRTPVEMIQYAQTADERGLEVIISGAGGAAHLPGMVASVTLLPVIGVPVNITKLEGRDSLLSILQMPKGVPVATVAIDNAYNAGLLAVRILANGDTTLKAKLAHYRESAKQKIKNANLRLKKSKF